MTEAPTARPWAFCLESAALLTGTGGVVGQGDSKGADRPWCMQKVIWWARSGLGLRVLVNMVRWSSAEVVAA